MSYQKELFDAVSRGDMDRVETLVERPDAKAAINKVFEESGQTILTEAARQGQYATIEFMLDKGADPCLVNALGQSPLHLAAFAGDERVVNLLLKSGAKLDILDEDGKAAVHWATRHNQKKVLEVLIQTGADVNVETAEGNTCLQESILSSKPDIVNVLLKTNAVMNHKNHRGESLLYSAARAGRVKVVEKLLSKGADFNSLTNNGETVLYESARLGHLSVIEYLFHFMHKYSDVQDIDEGYVDKQTTGGECEVNGLTVISEGWTALHVAVGQGHYDVVKYLLEHGATKDVRTGDGLTPADLCLAYKRKKIMPLFEPPKKVREATDEEMEEEGNRFTKKKGIDRNDWKF